MNTRKDGFVKLFANLGVNGFAFLLGSSWYLFNYFDVIYFHPLFVIFGQIIFNHRFVNYLPRHPFLRIVIPSMIFTCGVIIPVAQDLCAVSSQYLDQLDEIGYVLFDKAWNHATQINPLLKTLDKIYIMGALVNVFEMIFLFVKSLSLICFNFVMFLILSCF